MNFVPPEYAPLYRDFVRFWKTPKGLALALLSAIAVIALGREGFGQGAPIVLIATSVAAATDLAILQVRRQKLEFPDGALITGLIIALVMRTQEPWTVVAVTAFVAIASKHALRTRWSNVFNPAALAIVVSSLLFASAQSWWGALPDVGVFGFAVLLGTGLVIADRINKLPLIVVFAGTYFALFTIASFMGTPSQFAEVFRTPDLQAVTFFAFFMLDDPPTAPARYEDQVLFGAIVAVACFLIFTIYGVMYFLPAGLLAGNAWESGRRLFHTWYGGLLKQRRSAQREMA